MLCNNGDYSIIIHLCDNSILIMRLYNIAIIFACMINIKIGTKNVVKYGEEPFEDLSEDCFISEAICDIRYRPDATSQTRLACSTLTSIHALACTRVCFNREFTHTRVCCTCEFTHTRVCCTREFTHMHILEVSLVY